eukprot:752533-Hanusia_phi.AAC.1
MRAVLLLAAASSAYAFLPSSPLSPSSGLAKAPHCSLPLRSAARPRHAVGPRMQVQEIADQAMTLAAYPQGLVDAVTAYMNLYVPIFKVLHQKLSPLHSFAQFLSDSSLLALHCPSLPSLHVSLCHEWGAGLESSSIHAPLVSCGE